MTIVGRISANDAILLEEAQREAAAKNRIFFERNKITPAQQAEALEAWKKFSDNERAAGNGFYHSPLSLKAFTVGYWRRP